MTIHQRPLVIARNGRSKENPAPARLDRPPAARRFGQWYLLVLACLACISAQATGLTFNFTIDEPCKTSAGVYALDGTLVRSLWSKVSYQPGSYSASWDGLDNTGNPAPAGTYEVKLLQHNLEYVWDGAIGNSSAAVSGPTVHTGFWPIRGLSISGTNAFYVSGYNEGGYAFRNFLTTDPQHVANAWYWVYSKSLQALDSQSGTVADLSWLWSAADANRVYFACSGTFATPFSPHYDHAGCIVACDVNTRQPAYFAAGQMITNKDPNNPIPNGIFVGTQYGLSGLSVQQNGNLLTASVSPDNQVYLMDKVSGAPISSFTVPSPKRLNFSSDGSLWVVSGTSVLCYTNVAVAPTVAATLGNLSEPLDVAISPLNPDLIIVADGGTSQQLKAFDRSGNVLWTYGLPGGYQTNGVAVNTNKFWFFDGENDGTFLCFAPDGSFWLGDGGNNRCLHFSPDLRYLEQIMYQPFTHLSSVDKNNPSRVFNQFLEFSVDYSQPLAQSWKLVNNWRANVDSNHLTDDLGLREVVTLTNGHTYAYCDDVVHVENNTNTLRELCELTTNGLRFTGLFPLVTNQGRWMSLGADGSPRAIVFDATLSYATWCQESIQGFDASNNPIWGAEFPLASASNGPTDPIWRCCGFGNPYLPISSNNILISFDPSLNNGWHLGGVRLGGTNWLWKTAPAVTYMNGLGTFEIANQVQYAGSTARALDSHVLYGYPGEDFRGAGQACQIMHFLDDGLFVGQFGETTVGHFSYEGALPAEAGNADCLDFVSTTDGGYYLWLSDESGHSPQRWHLVNARNVREQSGVGLLGGSLTLTNPASFFPSRVTAKPGNQSAELSWLPVPGASFYTIRASLLNGGPYSRIVGATTNLDYVVGGLTNGLTYFFAVTATIGGSEQMPSEQVQVQPFDTAQPVIFAGDLAEGGKESLPFIEVSTPAADSGQPCFLDEKHETTVVNWQELCDYGYGNLMNRQIGTKGYVIYNWSGDGGHANHLLAPAVINPQLSWATEYYLNRYIRLDGVPGQTDGAATYSSGSFNIHTGDTNYHYLTYVSPPQFQNGRSFYLQMVSTNNASTTYQINEPHGYFHLLQFLFRGDNTLWVIATNGSYATVQALLMDDAAVTYQPPTVDTRPQPPQLTGVTSLNNGTVQFSFSSDAAHTSMTVLSTTNLLAPLKCWQPIGAATMIAPGQFQFTSPPDPTASQRYFQVQIR